MPVARLRTRALYAVINSRITWSDKLVLTEDARSELCFWKECLPMYNGQAIWFESGATRVAYSDANSSGYGGYVVEIGNSISHGHWSPAERDMSSTWREVRTVFAVLLAFAKKLHGHTINLSGLLITRMLYVSYKLVVTKSTCKRALCVYSRHT